MRSPARAKGMTGGCIRRVLTGGALALALAVGACKPPSSGPVRVTVIGEEEPSLADPARGPLSTPDAVLLQNVAQGLVRFDAQGNIEGGLAERWNVSDDGLSYIFRLQTGEWPGGRKITAQDVARIMRRQLARQSRNALKDTFGAVADVVAMTDRVIEIRLLAPRPHLLQLLAQPEFALVRNGEGTGPFTIDERDGGILQLERRLPGAGNERDERERVALRSGAADSAVRAFAEGGTDMVLGGTYADLPVAAATRLPRGALRFDPVAGLFGFAPARRGGLLDREEVRSLLDRALDREALVAAMNVSDLEARASLLQPGLDGGIVPAVPGWAAIPLSERRPELLAQAQRLLADDEEQGEQRPVLRVGLPEGPAGVLILRRLQADWGPLGLEVERAEKGKAADLQLVDLVAPSVSPAWFLRQFRCEVAPVCSEEADELMDAAREAPMVQQRNALLAEAERVLRGKSLFLPIAAPVRWSLVARDLPGFAENRFARHPLSNLRNRPGEER